MEKDLNTQVYSGLFQLISCVSLGSGFLVYKMKELEKVVCCMSFLSISAPAQPSVLLLICQHNMGLNLTPRSKFA